MSSQAQTSAHAPSASLRAPRYRGFTFTLNNPTEAEVPNLGAVLDESVEMSEIAFPLPTISAIAKYAICQLERAPDTGTPHLQGFVVLSHPRSFSGMRSLLPRAHWEDMKGTVEQNEVYCSKASTKVKGPWIVGQRPAGQGFRTDIEGAMNCVRCGMSEREIAEQHPVVWIKYYRALERLRRISAPDRSEPSFCTVFWGPSGSGKSLTASRLGPSGDTYWLTPPRTLGGASWWDGYSGESFVVIDEFFGWIKRGDFLRLCDRYPFMVETKGGMLKFTSKHIVVTSNLKPEHWWRKIGLGPMERRLKEPLGKVEYIGSDKYPTAADYLASDDYPLHNVVGTFQLNSQSKRSRLY